jgi:hypothetical protein
MHLYRNYHFHSYEKLRRHPADPGMVTFEAILGLPFGLGDATEE